MKNIKILVIVVFFLLISVAMKGQNGGGVDFKNIPLKELLAMAKQKGKIVFADCYTTWCGPCKRMAREVFPQKMVGDFMNTSFISTQIDMEQGEGIALKKLWDINSYPTLVVLGNDGNCLFRLVGYYEPQQLIDSLKYKINHFGLSDLERRYLNGECSSLLIYNYINELRRSNEQNKIATVTNDFLNSHTELLLNDSVAFRLFRENMKDPHNNAFLYVYQNKAHFIAKYGASINDLLEYVWRSFAKNYYIKDNTGNYVGYDDQKMTNYMIFMQQHGVAEAETYIMFYELPMSFVMNNNALLMFNLERSAKLKNISQSQFEYGCTLLEKYLTNNKDKNRLKEIIKIRNNNFNK